MAFSLMPSSMLDELGRLASWFKGDCVASEDFNGFSVTEKLENVQLLDKYNLRNPSKGTLYFATTHLIFVDHEMRKETWILLMHISSVERMPITTTGSPLLVRTKTFQSVLFVIPRERDCYEMHQTLLRLSQPVNLDELYCFHYKSSPDELPRTAGWNYFDLQTEYQRMNVPNEHWVLCPANKDYELCDTYPSHIYVPARASQAVLLGSASFRSRGRLPVLAYLHQNGAAIARCSQPLSGFSARCMEDEQMLDAIRRANPNQPWMYVVDMRPRINAMVNRAVGKGYENEAFYDNIKFEFMGIGNIHVMRKSLQKLVETCEQNTPTMSSFFSGLESSGWLKHIKSILDTARWIAVEVSGGASVCVHCSDGWDRTAQACSLAALLLDPHYRTINGYQALIEKDWLSFGHKFTARCAHIAGDSKERAPVFTQLLDCTWQLLRQMPEAFQFNERFLLTLHDHAHACQYGTFVGNCEKDRRDLRLSERTFSLWGYMASHLNEYKNPLYNPKAHPELIKPDLSAQSIRFWRGMYCRHESGVHPREALADLLPAAVDHATALALHVDYLARRIATFKSLLSGRKAKKEGAVNYQNGNTDTGLETATQQLTIDNKLIYESSGLSELECANHDHPLKEDTSKPDRIPLITEKTDASIPSTLAQLEAEMGSVALDWRSIKNVTECSCSTPLDHFSRKHHCWGCGRCVCTRCVTRRALPALATPRAVPLCTTCAPAATPDTPAPAPPDLVTSAN
ncbi:myotubularin-related protein 8 isoform X2 [Aricia agestis]|uniref:myotubularin-related protein 8 isoform X1 n=1 Tax=Aricia agestis TaxID=91739 RepID=UPI001C205AF9|nr:myotubularin-related protein 8 isoform X1 [Aricia agestis]XP_041970089.1 myotubularin-related protein 8 isoform X2 [Aricia agestis]